MATYVKRSCGRCGRVLEGWDLAHRGLGEPFVKCPGCGSINSRRHVNEWAFMGLVERAIHLFSTFWSALALGAIGGAIGCWLLYRGWIALTGGAARSIYTAQLIAAAVGFGAVIWLGILDTMESIKRTGDPSYRRQLEGFLRANPIRIGAEEIWAILGMIGVTLLIAGLIWAWTQGAFADA